MSTLSAAPSTVPDQPISLQTVHGTAAVEAHHQEDNSKGTTDGAPTEEYDPWEPPHPPPRPSLADLTCPAQHMREVKILILQYMLQLQRFLADARATNIISPDRTPRETLVKYYGKHDRLSAVLRKDSVPRFLRIFENYRESFVSDFVIIPQTLDLIILHNALRCANLVLEGKSPKLCEIRANPNYMTSFGYSPLHQAAESFSAEMVELLFRYGASANQRTSGNKIIQGLLPLHVAIENTCQHKYLEDNLLVDEDYRKGNVEYIYKLIYLLCLPEMKIFLDTTRSLAAHTDNVVDELWNYIKQGKLVPTAILLLAAQNHCRNLNVFDIIKARIEDSMCGLGSSKNAKEKKELKEMKVHLINALVLVRIIHKTGEALEAYIQTHSEASHEEVLGKVSAVLQNYSGKEICIEDLDCSPYDCGGPDGDTYLTKAAIGSPTLEVKNKRAAAKKPRVSHLYARDRFFPVWRSVLTARFITSIFPAYTPKKELPLYIFDAGIVSEKLRAERHSHILLGTLERNYPRVASKPAPTSKYRSRRLFGTAASTVLKMLKRV
ncbi:uncharacterized protein LOC123396168 [Hordeum vulgare subsp. vulgare]|uniref:uncharacterized protein LOC123396168 n=1 Tax=Hordeum vulgare subsp. vulgare TaxID=112509 RepID=UPI001D1A4834|nr:uncharacterized protein LOC123396168 [Hordeum vulgare subsp. vulgare]